jgi:hypothetical protein
MTKTKTELQEVLEAISLLRDAVTRLEGAVYATRPSMPWTLPIPASPPLPHPAYPPLQPGWPLSETICSTNPDTAANVQLTEPIQADNTEQAKAEAFRIRQSNGWDLLNPNHPSARQNRQVDPQPEAQQEQPKKRKARAPKETSPEPQQQTAAVVHTPVAQTVSPVVVPTPPVDDVFGLGL